MKNVICILLTCSLLSGCLFNIKGGTVNLGTAPACMPFTFTAAPPAGVTVGPVTIAGLPPSLTVVGMGITGTPTWAEVSSYTVTATAAVTSPVSWYQTTTWVGTGNLVVSNPPVTAPLPRMTIPAFQQTSNTVTITVAPAATAPPFCGPYNATYPTRVPGLAQISVLPATPQADASDSITLQLARENNVTGGGTVPVTLTPTGPGGGPSFVINVPFTAL